MCVAKVRTMNYPLESKSKYTKTGMVTAVSGGYKKTIVHLAERASIDFYNNI